MCRFRDPGRQVQEPIARIRVLCEAGKGQEDHVDRAGISIISDQLELMAHRASPRICNATLKF